MYLLNLRILTLTKERKEQIERDREQKAERLYQLRQKTIQDMWRDDLNDMMATLEVSYLKYTQCVCLLVT